MRRLLRAQRDNRVWTAVTTTMNFIYCNAGRQKSNKRTLPKLLVDLLKSGKS